MGIITGAQHENRWIFCVFAAAAVVHARTVESSQNSHVVVTGAIERYYQNEKFNKYIDEENAPFFILLIINIIGWNHKILSNINVNIAELITFNKRDGECTKHVELEWMCVL